MKLKITIALFLFIFIGLIQVAKADFFGKNPKWTLNESSMTQTTYCKIYGWEIIKFDKYVMHKQKNCRCVTDRGGQFGIERSAEFEGTSRDRYAFIQDTNDLNIIYDSNRTSPRLLFNFNLKTGDTSRFYVEISKLDTTQKRRNTYQYLSYKVLIAKDTMLLGEKLKLQRLEITDSYIVHSKRMGAPNKVQLLLVEKFGFLFERSSTYDLNTIFSYHYISDDNYLSFTQYCDDDSLKYPNQHASAAQCLTFPTEIETPEQLAKKLTVKYFSQNHSIYFGDLSENKYTIQLFDLNGRKIPFNFESNNVINIDPNIHNSLILCQISYKGSPITTKKIIVN